MLRAITYNISTFAIWQTVILGPLGKCLKLADNDVLRVCTHFGFSISLVSMTKWRKLPTSWQLCPLTQITSLWNSSRQRHKRWVEFLHALTHV